MRSLLIRLVTHDRGQDLAEYGIALAIIATGVVLVAVSLGADVQSLWTTGQTSIGVAASN